MVNTSVTKSVAENVAFLKQCEARPVIVHGGGPVIKEVLELARIESEFIEGHRITTGEAMEYIEMALSDKVNGRLVSLINQTGEPAVGLSGKDGQTVIAQKRFHKQGDREIDLGYVGDVKEVNPNLVQSLLDDDYIPVVSPVSADKTGDTYNINADMFAGHLAGALKASHFIALTDVDGLLADKNDASSLIEKISSKKAKNEIGGIIRGGMIPKVEACLIALEKGVKSAHIINGMNRNSLLQELLARERSGTLISNSE